MGELHQGFWENLGTNKRLENAKENMKGKGEGMTNENKRLPDI